jgi:phosphoribosyl 1,2-cyclic phosphodiesterase
VNVTFYGVRGSIPMPGPGTVRYGGNTACILVRLSDGGLIVLDCGTGARTLGLALKPPELNGGREVTFLLSHSHWDHIQGFPFFRPFYGPSNRFTIYGGASSPERLEALLEGQMAAEYFPLQTFRNMGAHIEVRAIPAQEVFRVGGAVVHAHANPHGPGHTFAYRIEDQGRVLVYAADVGYADDGPTAQALALYRQADLLIHEATFLPEHQPPRNVRGLSSINDAVDAGLAAGAKRLALFHYGEPYGDPEIDVLIARARERAGAALPVIGAVEGASLEV